MTGGTHKTTGRNTLARRDMLALLLPAGAALALRAGPAWAAGYYPWQAADGVPGAIETLELRFPPPPGFTRLPVQAGSFAAWLRGLPMQPLGAPVHLHDGAEKPRQDVHAGVIAIDTGRRDLQQCADAIMRLRAEWLFGAGRLDDIAFTMTGGGRVSFARWRKGERPSPSGRSWSKKAAADSSYENFRRYLDFVFAYAGTASLEKELAAVETSGLEAGDVFIKGGFPGHAVLVADVAEHATTKARRFLLMQSYMPAQDIHVLKNPANGDGSPWYAPPARELVTPEWTFPTGSLKRWP